MKHYLHSKQLHEMMKAGTVSPSNVSDYVMNDRLPYPGVFSFPNEIIEAIETAAYQSGRDYMLRNYDVKERT